MEILFVTNQLITIIKEKLDQKTGKNIESASEFFYYHVLERIQCNCQGIQLIMDNPNNFARAEHSLGLTCRNQLSDLLVSYYIISESNSEVEINEKILLLFNDDYKHLMSLLNNVNHSEDIKKTIKNTKDDFETGFATLNRTKKLSC